jgi:endonuclease YncB( thermonuclease family)
MPKLFIAALTLIVSCATALNSLASSCKATGKLKLVHIHKAIDGDTIKLFNGERVRLIGINAPELGKNSRPAEPLAYTARGTLQSLITQHYSHAYLQFGKQRRDKYGRLLAHVYFGRTNAQAALLEQGLAFNLPYPPNLGLQPCYKRRVTIAKKQRKGIWATSLGRARNAATLDSRVTGFRSIMGTVSRVTFTRRNIWINFRSRRIAIQIRRSDEKFFNRKRLENLRGKRIIAQGYVFRVNRNRRRFEYLRMLLRHQDMLEPAPEQQRNKNDR